MGEDIFPAELSPLLDISKLLTDYSLKGMICCILSGLELVNGHLGQEMGIPSCFLYL